MITVMGGPHDGETLDTVSVATVEMAHVVDDELVGVAIYHLNEERTELRFAGYERHV